METRKRQRKALVERIERDGIPVGQFSEWVDSLPLGEFFALVDLHSPLARPRKARKKPPATPTRYPVKSSDDLCRELVCMAALNLSDQPQAQDAVYRTVRQLQLLDRAARAAGLHVVD